MRERWCSERLRRAGFLDLSSDLILDRIILYRGDSPGLCRRRSTPGPHLLRASSTFQPSSDNQKYLQTLLVVTWGAKSPRWRTTDVALRHHHVRVRERMKLRKTNPRGRTDTGERGFQKPSEGGFQRTNWTGEGRRREGRGGGSVKARIETCPQAACPQGSDWTRKEGGTATPTVQGCTASLDGAWGAPPGAEQPPEAAIPCPWRRWPGKFCPQQASQGRAQEGHGVRVQGSGCLPIMSLCVAQ